MSTPVVHNILPVSHIQLATGCYSACTIPRPKI